jgi:3-methylcrotonyl-CoA carboxylase alpha subunit
MFDKILIANRGEIACRVIRTAKRLGIRTVAVYSDADDEALHVKQADEAYHIGAAPASESYLLADKILEVAKKSGAQAVHPGYGFMSENAEFSEACDAAGIVFIGPPPSAIRAMGSKSEAKSIMSAATVPLVPGYHGNEQAPDFLAAEAEKIGYPLLVKASAGGGGKGMRVVESADKFLAALDSAKRESRSSFGDDHVLLERYLTKPRHVEVQVFADTHGNCIHLFERDCSVQRRHQKVLEEAPAPGMTAELRAEMGRAAVAAAKQIGYVGAGTVEFLLDEDGSFYFMEMNTRLQVEHPVTEMITGEDLVEWQLEVAAGLPLPKKQFELQITGHAFEARVYAEDPKNNFLPATGRLRYMRTPDASAHVRVDTGVAQGDEVSVHYDPMIAKLIVWDQDRGAALRRLRNALENFLVVGVTTNLEFLGTIAAIPAFANADLTTNFIAQHEQELLPTEQPLSDDMLALAVLSELLNNNRIAADRAARSADPSSPWSINTGWRLNEDNHHAFRFHHGETLVEIVVHYRNDHYLLELPSGKVEAHATQQDDGCILADLGGRRVRGVVIRHGYELTILHGGSGQVLILEDPLKTSVEHEGAGGGLTAPMTGTVVTINVAAGASVTKGDALMIVEAMKMEHTITAPRDGTVTEIFFSVGDAVNDGVELLKLAESSDE